jgi:hypothetical protein
MPDDAPLHEHQDPSGSPDPKPPTAVTVSVSESPRPRRSILNALQSDPRTRKAVDNAIRIMFDAADNVADEIASVLRLRRPGGSSPNLPAKIPPEPPLA